MIKKKNTQTLTSNHKTTTKIMTPLDLTKKKQKIKMETSSQSAVCKSLLYSKSKTNKKHTESHLGRDHTKLGRRNVKRSQPQQQTNNNKAAMERRESEISTATLAVNNTNQNHSQLCSQAQIKICIVLFCHYVYQHSQQSTYFHLIHTDTDTLTRASTFHSPVDISSAPTDSALSGIDSSFCSSLAHSLFQSHFQVLCFDQQAAAFLSYSLSIQ